MILLCFFFLMCNTKCVNVFNKTPSSSNDSYIVYCPKYLPTIFPTSCSCGNSSLFRFFTMPGLGLDIMNVIVVN